MDKYPRLYVFLMDKSATERLIAPLRDAVLYADSVFQVTDSESVPSPDEQEQKRGTQCERAKQIEIITMGTTAYTMPV